MVFLFMNNVRFIGKNGFGYGQPQETLLPISSAYIIYNKNEKF